MTSVFLSYARSDDEPFVERLRDDLAAHGIDVWWDRTSMESRGRTFHQEILDAIDRCERTVLVVGPNVAKSAYVRQEREYAERAEKPIAPILRCGDHACVPHELRNLHCEDFREGVSYPRALANLVRQLSTPPPPLGKLFNVPELPTHYLLREDLLASFRKELREGLDSPEAIGPAQQRTAIQGMAGVGKSTLAAALARDRKVREAFPDGIIWIKLGKSFDIVDRMGRIDRALGGDGKFATEDDGRNRLRDALATRSVLLTLDDAWDRKDVYAFDFLGHRCRTLVTTRDAGLLPSQRDVRRVDTLDEVQATLLLAQAAECEADEFPAEALAVRDRCGGLPLALCLAGGMVATGTAWTELLEALESHRIERLSDEHRDEQHQDLFRAVDVSVAALSEAERSRFAELAVFAEADVLPEAAIATLWRHSGGLDRLEVRSLLAKLDRRALLRLEIPHGARLGIVRLHDIIREYCLRRVQIHGGGKAALHDLLVSAYRVENPDDRLPSLPDDYYVARFPTHLARAGRWSELSALVQDADWDLLTRWTQRGGWRQGLECLEGLLQLHERNGSNVDRAGVATQLARIHSVQGNVDDARRHLQTALSISEGWRGRRIRSVACHELASTHLYRGERAEARERYRQALQECLLPPPIRDEAAANLIGLATLDLLDYRPLAAAENAERAIDFACQAGDVIHEIAARRTSAISLRDLLRMDEAARGLKTASEKAESADLRHEIIACANASAWLRYHMAVMNATPLHDARRLFEENQARARESRYLGYDAEASIGLLWCALADRNAAEAQSLVADFERRGIDATVPGNIAASLQVGAASATLLRGEYADATMRFDKASKFCGASSERSREADALAGLGAALWLSGRHAEAEERWAAAAETAQTPLRRKLVALTIERNRRQGPVAPL